MKRELSYLPFCRSSLRLIYFQLRGSQLFVVRPHQIIHIIQYILVGAGVSLKYFPPVPPAPMLCWHRYEPKHNFWLYQLFAKCSLLDIWDPVNTCSVYWGGNFIEHVQINCHSPDSCPIRTFLPVRGVWGPSLIGWGTGKLLPELPVPPCDWLTTTGRGGSPYHTQWRNDSCSFLSQVSALKIFCSS